MSEARADQISHLIGILQLAEIFKEHMICESWLIIYLCAKDSEAEV